MAAQDISFQSMSDKMQRYVNIVMKDPAVDSVVGFAGGNTAQTKAGSS
jgi:multidrug efflux pump